MNRGAHALDAPNSPPASQRWGGRSPVLRPMQRCHPRPPRRAVPMAPPNNSFLQSPSHPPPQEFYLTTPCLLRRARGGGGLLCH